MYVCVFRYVCVLVHVSIHIRMYNCCVRHSQWYSVSPVTVYFYCALLSVLAVQLSPFCLYL